MHHRLLAILTLLLLAGCQTQPSLTPSPQPTSPLAPVPGVPTPESNIPITDDSGAIISSQPGPYWVLISGVDEHGLIAEHEVMLLSEARADAPSLQPVHTGVAAFVYEIRQSGPQSLRRFYRIQAISGPSGWVSDYYVRRVAYLFNAQGETVAVYATPGGELVIEAANVSPVIIKEPINPTWWQVESPDGAWSGWVRADQVKESPEMEFLLNQQHSHGGG